MLPDVRDMTEADVEALVSADGGAWWRTDRGYWAECLRERARGTRQVVLARLKDKIAGYAYLNWSSQYPPFKEAGTPEISDLRVGERYRRNGVATAIVAHFERVAIAAGRRTIGLGVGLYADYGSAQRLYVRLGFAPDGRGVTSQNRPAEPGTSVRLDDDLLLWLVKDIGVTKADPKIHNEVP